MLGALSKYYRWGFALRGLAAVVFGVLALIWPGITLMVLLVLFGIYAIADGVFALVGSIEWRMELSDWWLILLAGLASIALGVLAFARPGITALVLLFFIAVRAMVVGVLDIASAIRYRRVISGEWLLILSGACSIAFSLLLLAYPMSGALAVIWLIGIYAIVVGLLQVGFAAGARRLEARIEEMPERPHLAA